MQSHLQILVAVAAAAAAAAVAVAVAVAAAAVAAVAAVVVGAAYTIAAVLNLPDFLETALKVALDAAYKNMKEKV